MKRTITIYVEIENDKDPNALSGILSILEDALPSGWTMISIKNEARPDSPREYTSCYSTKEY